MDNNDAIELMKIFHYSTQLPVFSVERGEITFALPAFPVTAESVFEQEPGLPLSFDNQPAAVQYIATPYNEQFLIYPLSESAFVASGPFLTEPMSGKAIVEMIKTKQISLKKKQALDEHYGSVRQLTSQAYYYSGQLMQKLFRNATAEALPYAQPSSAGTRIDAFYQNIYKDRKKTFAHPPYFLEKKVAGFVRTGNLKGALDTIREINRLERAVLAEDQLRSLKNSIICSCAFVARASIDAGVSPDIAFSYSDAFIQKIEKLSSLKEVNQTEIDMLTQYIGVVNERLAQKYSHVVVQAMHCIDENLTAALTLADIAAYANVNPQYLSTVFKKETGQAVTEYIASQRVKESTYFVAHTDYEITDIASLYCFCNQSYYITVFKKIMGLTPGEYRVSKCAKDQDV